MVVVETMSDAELRDKLSEYGIQAGPVTDSTRKLYKKKLLEIMSSSSQKNRKSLASFSSGEDDEEGHEEIKGRRGGASMLPPPLNPPRNSKRKTLGPPVVPPSSNAPGRRSVGAGGSKGSRTSLNSETVVIPVVTPNKPLPGTPRPSSRPRVPQGVILTEMPQRYDYETGSDNDDKTNLKLKPVSSKSKTNKKTDREPSFLSNRYANMVSHTNRPLDLPVPYGSMPSLRHQYRDQRESQERQPSPAFCSKFGRSLGEAASPSSHNGHFSSQANIPPSMRAHAASPQTEEHSWWSSAVVSKLLIAVLVVFFSYLAYCYMGMRSGPDYAPQLLVSFESNPENRFPLCKDGQMPGVNCVLPGEARAAMAALKSVVPRLTQEAVMMACNPTEGNELGPSSSENQQDDLDLPPGALSFKQIEQILELGGDPDSENSVANMRILARHNPHWGVKVLERGMLVADPPLPLICFLRHKLAFIFYTSLLIFVALCALGAMYWAYQSYADSRLLAEQQVFSLVSRIADSLAARRHADEIAGVDSTTYVAVNHLRDELIPPQDRKRLEAIWGRAVEFVDANDSRVRVEVRRVSGEEVQALVWLPPKLSPQPTQSRRSMLSTFLPDGDQDNTSSPASPASQGIETPTRRLRVWQGQAFETMEGSVNSLPCSPTPCLKIRHMFDPDVARGQGRETEEEIAWPDRIKDAILEKCGESVNVLHVWVDKKSLEGCVFVKCASPADAGRAYRALHGSWYDGNLVTVKYLRVERYHERFPDSVNVCIPLRPSNNQKLSLQAHCWQPALERN